MSSIISITKWCKFHNKPTLRGSSIENMLVELCYRNYATHDGLVNGAYGIFQGSIKIFNS